MVWRGRGGCTQGGECGPHGSDGPFPPAVFQVRVPRGSGLGDCEGDLGHGLPLLRHLHPGHPGRFGQRGLLSRRSVMPGGDDSPSVPAVPCVRLGQQCGLHWDVPDHDEEGSHHGAGGCGATVRGCAIGLYHCQPPWCCQVAPASRACTGCHSGVAPSPPGSPSSMGQHGRRLAGLC